MPLYIFLGSDLKKSRYFLDIIIGFWDIHILKNALLNELFFYDQP